MILIILSEFLCHAFKKSPPSKKCKKQTSLFTRRFRAPFCFRFSHQDRPESKNKLTPIIFSTNLPRVIDKLDTSWLMNCPHCMNMCVTEASISYLSTLRMHTISRGGGSSIPSTPTLGSLSLYAKFYF